MFHSIEKINLYTRGGYFIFFQIEIRKKKNLWLFLRNLDNSKQNEITQLRNELDNSRNTLDTSTDISLKLETLKDINEKEIELIKEYKELGFNLCNLSEGGDGITGYKHTNTAKEKISLSFKKISWWFVDKILLTLFAIFVSS